MNEIKTSPILSIGFRPFFLLAALIAFINPPLWVSSFLGDFSLSLNTDPLFWHGHEMIFGFSGALIAGFILTASANWTNSTPYQGAPLLFLIFIWLLERTSYFLPISREINFILMNLFFPTLTFMLLKKLWKFPKQRNIFVLLLGGITLSKLLHSWGYFYSSDHLEIAGRHLALGLIRLFILLIAGRVIPFFSRKRIEGIEINVPGLLTPLSLLPLLLLAIPRLESTPIYLVAGLFVWAIIANTIRFLFWRPHKTIKVPILFILNIGIIFIILNLAQELIGLFNDEMNFSQSALHILMAGGLGVVGMGIMTRVSLGHTGRIIKASRATQFAYLCIILGALLRSFLPLFNADYYLESLHFVVGLWSLGFLVFLVAFFKLLVTVRPDES